MGIVRHYRQGDRYPTLLQALIDGNGAVVDLTSAASVKFQMSKRGETAKVDAAAVVEDATGGEVSYSWGSTDLSELGEFDAGWEVTWTGSATETYPQKYGEFTIVVGPAPA